jgi:hypothetical protein
VTDSPETTVDSREPPFLSVVMVNRCRKATLPVEAFTALTRELVVGDELVWVDRTGLAAPASAGANRIQVRSVHSDSRASRGRCYALGLAAATGSVVAFTDSTTVVQPGWRAALIDGATEHAVIGGPVLPAGPKSRRDWAGFLVDYAAHAVPPYRSATGDVSGNNVAYRRKHLPTTASELWKSQVNTVLSTQGEPPVVVAGMRVLSRRSYSWRDLLVGRARSGALYGAERCTRWSTLRRWTAAVGCLALPAVAVARIGHRLSGDRSLAHQLALSLPVVLAAQTAWAFGEATGYVSRRGDGTDVW